MIAVLTYSCAPISPALDNRPVHSSGGHHLLALLPPGRPSLLSASRSRGSTRPFSCSGESCGLLFFAANEASFFLAEITLACLLVVPEEGPQRRKKAIFLSTAISTPVNNFDGQFVGTTPSKLLVCKRTKYNMKVVAWQAKLSNP